jgi:hypothetical protein
VDGAQTMAVMTGPVEVLEGGTALPPHRRRLLVVIGVAVVLVCGGLWFRDWSAERALRQAVQLTTTFGVSSSSTSPPGGSVRYFVLVRNDGARPLTVTSVVASIPGLRVRMRDVGGRRIAAGRQIEIPLSARLTCGDGVGAAAGLTAAIVVRREDGGSATRRVALTPASLVLDVAATLCDVRPELRDHELSGPVLRAG